MSYPLQGVKILDFSRYLPGPFCSMTLAQLGADVLRVENPDSSEREDFDWVFYAANTNKRSITLNLKTEQGRAIVYQLVKNVDVVLESFRPGVTTRLGIDFETLRQLNPRLVYCSMTGYGQTGPYHLLPGHDLNYMGIAGVLGLNEILTGPAAGKEGTLVRPGITVADLSAGMYAALSIVSALKQVTTKGEGVYLDCSITDCIVSWMITRAGTYLATRQQPTLAEMGLLAPTNRVYQAKDGKYLSLAAVEDHFWQGLCETLGLKALLENPAYGTHRQRTAAREEIIPILETAFKQRLRDEWVELLMQKGIPCAPVHLTVDEVLADAQIQNRQPVQEVPEAAGKKMLQLDFPVKGKNWTTKLESGPPQLGQHTIEILQELGLDLNQIEELKRIKII